MDLDLTLERFREAIRRLDPTRPLRLPDQAGWRVDRPDVSATGLVGPLQLEPTWVHLVVGAIGCGKSTELLAAERELTATPGILAHYVDVTAAIDLTRATPDAVGAAVGVDVARGLAERHSEAALTKTWDEIAHGWWDYPEDGNAWDFPPADYMEWRGGALPRPQPGYRDERIPIEFESLCAATRRLESSGLVVLVDGLDRLPDASLFDALARPLISALRDAGIGAAIVAPWGQITGVRRPDADRWVDEVHEVGPVVPGPGSPGERFLTEVLRARDVGGLFAPDALPAVVSASGGVLRDLIHVAKASVQSAWARRASTVSGDDVRVATDKLGRMLVLGLSADEVTLLDSVRQTGRFVPTSDTQRALVPTKRVLQYRGPNGLPEFAVHPAIEPLLESISSAS